MKARTIHGKSTEEIREALNQCLQDSFAPTLAIVFISIARDRNAICKVFTDKDIQVFGATTSGEIIDEHIGKESIAIMLLDINPAYFSVLFTEYKEKNYREAASRIAKNALESFKTPTFLIAGSNMETDAEQLLYGFEDVIGKHVNVFGGMAGDNYKFTEQFVFTNDQYTNTGLVVLTLDEDKVEINGRATCGWKPVGTAKTVTKSEGNHVYTIEDIPALDLTAKYGGIENITPDNKDMMMEIATNFPLQLQRETGDPIMRPGLMVDWEDHSFYCSGTVPQGAKVRFSLPPDFDVMEKVIRAAEDMKEKEMPEADAVIVFSCAGRILALGPLMDKEIEGVNKVWNVPMVGMFSHGELGRATGGNLEMHNLTTCCVALKEK